MSSIKQLVVLALAGIAVAAPNGGWSGNWSGNNGGKWVATPTDSAHVSIVTVYVNGDEKPNNGGHMANNGGSHKSHSDESGATTIATTTATGWTPVAATSAAAAPAASGGSSSGGLDDYMSIVSKYRAAGGLPALTQSSSLEASAQSCANAQKGDGSMTHILGSGVMAQVLAPGSSSDFEHVYVGGWLCEIPTLKGLDGVCATQDAGWSHGSETGHAEILTSTTYKNIGCALGQGIWACNLS